MIWVFPQPPRSLIMYAYMLWWLWSHHSSKITQQPTSRTGKCDLWVLHFHQQSYRLSCIIHDNPIHPPWHTAKHMCGPFMWWATGSLIWSQTHAQTVYCIYAVLEWKTNKGKNISLPFLKYTDGTNSCTKRWNFTKLYVWYLLIVT